MKPNPRLILVLIAGAALSLTPGRAAESSCEPGTSVASAGNPPADVPSGTLGVTAFFKSAESLVGKQVVVEGLATHACRRSGKKLFIRDLDPNAKGQLRVNHTDQVPLFKADVEGQTVLITGIVREQHIDSAYLDNWEARAKGGTSAPSKVQGGPDECQDKDKDPATLKQIAKLRERVAASPKGYLLSVWLDATQWQSKPAQP